MRTRLQSEEGTAKQPRLPRNGAILLLQSRNSKRNAGAHPGSQKPLGSWELGRSSPSGRGQEGPAPAWLCRAGDTQRGAGQTFPGCLIKRVSKSQ